MTSAAPDPFDLERFVEAQDGVYPDVLAELRAGRKRSHWMWFVFPQIAGLGSSATSRHYAIKSLDEAKAYLKHPLLGPRLNECVGLVLQAAKTPRDIFGGIDELKFRSCMSLFAHVSPENGVFHQALAKYYSGQPDSRTLDLLR